MRSVSVRELKTQTAEILRRVREERDSIQVTYRGKIIALPVPVQDATTAKREDTGAIWTDLDRLAAEISAHWPEGVTAAEAVSEQRRRR